METKIVAKECCPPFDPALWDNKTHIWIDKLFIRDSIPQLFHFPLPWMVGKVITRLWEKAQDAGAAPDIKEFIMLSQDPSPWKSNFLLAVNKEVANADNVKLTGTFISKVYDGPFNHIPRYINDLNDFLAKQGKKAKEYYFYFTTCPKCTKKYNHNYIVAFAELENQE
jgi:hypothetical protein